MEIIKRNTDYALNALVRLGMTPGEVVSTATISSEMDLPQGFLQKIMQKFSRAGYVKSHRGMAGGFSLNRPADEITVLDIMQTMQGPVVLNLCLLGKDACPRASRCPIKESWVAAQSGLVDFLKGMTLQDMVNQAKSHQT